MREFTGEVELGFMLLPEAHQAPNHAPLLEADKWHTNEQVK